MRECARARVSVCVRGGAFSCLCIFNRNNSRTSNAYSKFMADMVAKITKSNLTGMQNFSQKGRKEMQRAFQILSIGRN